MEQKTIIIIGQSGAGKGTQAKLLNEYLKNNSVGMSVLYIETGARFRKFIQEDPSYTAACAKELMKKGERQPDFLAVWNWGQMLVESMKENTHLVMDGVPRSLLEAQILATAFPFYGRDNTYVIYLKVSDEWSVKNLMNRGRADDMSTENIMTKLSWFQKVVAPAVDFFRTSAEFCFVEINGEQTIEKIHDEIITIVCPQS